MIETLCDKYGKGKVFIAFLTLGSVICLLLWLGIRYQNNSFKWEGKSFRLIRTNVTNAWVKDNEGNTIKIKLDKGGIPGVMRLMTFEYLGETITYDSMNRFEEGVKVNVNQELVYQDKEDSGITIHVSNEKEVGKVMPAQAKLAYEIDRALDQEFSVGKILIVWGLHILIIIGALMNFIYPGVAWELKHFSDVDGGEPSYWYFEKCKIGGWVMIGFACIYPIIILMQR